MRSITRAAPNRQVLPSSVRRSHSNGRLSRRPHRLSFEARSFSRRQIGQNAAGRPSEAITDNGSKVLSVKRLPRITKVALRDELETLIAKLETAAQPARDARDRYIAHLEFEILRNPTLHDAIVPERQLVLTAIKAIDDLIHFVDHHVTKSDPVMWEHLDLLGGADALHDIVRRGLRDREERLALHDLS